MNTGSQKTAILAQLKRGHSITPQEALRSFGCFRLAARIKELRDDGYTITTEIETDLLGSRFARYHMTKT